MFEYLKDLRNEEIEKKSLKIKLDTIKDGVNLFDNYIIIKKQKKLISIKFQYKNFFQCINQAN